MRNSTLDSVEQKIIEVEGKSEEVTPLPTES